MFAVILSSLCARDSAKGYSQPTDSFSLDWTEIPAILYPETFSAKEDIVHLSLVPLLPNSQSLRLLVFCDIEQLLLPVPLTPDHLICFHTRFRHLRSRYFPRCVLHASLHVLETLLKLNLAEFETYVFLVHLFAGRKCRVNHLVRSFWLQLGDSHNREILTLARRRVTELQANAC